MPLQDGKYQNELPLKWWEELFATVLLLIFPGCMLWLWFALIYIGYRVYLDPFGLFSMSPHDPRTVSSYRR